MFVWNWATRLLPINLRFAWILRGASAKPEFPRRRRRFHGNILQETVGSLPSLCHQRSEFHGEFWTKVSSFKQDWIGFGEPFHHRLIGGLDQGFDLQSTSVLVGWCHYLPVIMPHLQYHSAKPPNFAAKTSDAPMLLRVTSAIFMQCSHSLWFKSAPLTHWNRRFWFSLEN